MVQDQLVDYVSSQLKLGISRDAIKSALTGVGWAPLDVEDTLKKVEGGVTSIPAQPAVLQKAMDAAGGAAASPKFVSFSGPGTVAGQVKNPEPQTVRVSDLVSAIAPTSSVPAGTAPKVISGTMDAGKTSTKGPFLKEPQPIFTVQSGQKKKGIGLFAIIAVALIVLLGALAGYLFFKNSSLSNQLQAQSGQNQGAAQSSVAAAAQGQSLNASNTALAAEVTSLTAENQNLTTNLLLLTAPLGLTSPTTSMLISVSGTLSAGLGKNTYVITTPYGVKAYVKNSSDSGVAAALQQLLGTTVNISGTFIPGTPDVTVASVNGLPISLPSMATTTTITTTTTTTTSTKTITITP